MDSWDMSSLYAFDSEFGTDWAVLPQGYAYLLNGLDPTQLNIKLNSPVVRVSVLSVTCLPRRCCEARLARPALLLYKQVEYYDTTGGVLVYVGDAAGSVYNASRVVVTVPLGVLKVRPALRCDAPALCGGEARSPRPHSFTLLAGSVTACMPAPRSLSTLSILSLLSPSSHSHRHFVG